jgi:hypothetical protein
MFPGLFISLQCRHPLLVGFQIEMGPASLYLHVGFYV